MTRLLKRFVFRKCSHKMIVSWSPFQAARIVLALWDILLKLGYKIDALYVNLGIGSYSESSQKKSCTFPRLWPQDVVPCSISIPSSEKKEPAFVSSLCWSTARRARHAARSNAIDSTMRQSSMGTMSWRRDIIWMMKRLDCWGTCCTGRTNTSYKQGPSLPASVDGFAKKVKPLYRLTERELAAYCVLNRIDYVVEECPMAQGARTLLYKEVLNRLETESPRTKQMFYWGFLESRARRGHRRLSWRKIVRPYTPALCAVSPPRLRPALTVSLWPEQKLHLLADPFGPCKPFLHSVS